MLAAVRASVPHSALAVWADAEGAEPGADFLPVAKARLQGLHPDPRAAVPPLAARCLAALAARLPALRDAACLLLAEEGLEEAELEACVEGPRAALAAALHALEPLLVRAHGGLYFASEAARDGAAAALLTDPEGTPDPLALRPREEALAAHFGGLPACRRRAARLPPLLARLGRRGELKAALLDLDALAVAAADADLRHEAPRLWRGTGLPPREVAGAYLEALRHRYGLALELPPAPDAGPPPAPAPPPTPGYQRARTAGRARRRGEGAPTPAAAPPKEAAAAAAGPVQGAEAREGPRYVAVLAAVAALLARLAAEELEPLLESLAAEAEAAQARHAGLL